MKKNKSSVSKAASYKEIGEFWDEHDLADFWEQLEPVNFEVEIESETTYFPIESNLSNKLTQIAKKRGVSPETLLNLRVQEKTAEESSIRK